MKTETHKFQPGDRVRALVKTLGGWQGHGVVLKESGGCVEIRPLGRGQRGPYLFCDFELEKTGEGR